MIKVFKYKNGEIKIMWNEQPMHKSYEYDRYNKIIKKNTYKVNESSLIGMEMNINKGGRICYGMLMAQVKPSEILDEVRISIEFTHKNTARYYNSSLFNDTHVYKGLPEEYVEQISDSIVKVISEKVDFPQCDISFEYAANCEIGSSPMLFGIIAEIIMNIICTSSDDKISNMSIADFTKQYISKINMIY